MTEPAQIADKIVQRWLATEYPDIETSVSELRHIIADEIRKAAQ